MRKRILALLACGALAATSMVGLVGCGGDDDNGGNKTALTVWGPDAQQTTLKEMVAKFVEANPDYTVNVGVCSEGDAYGEVSKDPSAAADVFAFANDQLVNLIRVGGLAEVGGSYKTKVEAENTAASVGLGTFDGKLYGYPYSADNGYFMYYDSSVVSEEDAETLEGIVAACEKAGKKIAWEIGNGWYDVSWFFAFGCSYTVEYNEDFTEKSVVCNFNNANGVKAAKAIRVLADSDSFIGPGVSTDSVKARIATGDEGDIAVAVTGSWNAETIQNGLGDNFAATKLPTVTVDGETKQLSSFVGGKLLGVNPHSKDLVGAHKLAQFLSSEEMQAIRFEKHLVGPSNKNVAELDAVKNNVVMNAFAMQAACGVAQTSVPSNFWDPVDAFCTWVSSKEGSEGGYVASELQAQLDAMNEQIVPKAELVACYLVGNINGVNLWPSEADPTDDRMMTKNDDGTWSIEFTITEASSVKGIAVDSRGGIDWQNDPNTEIEEAGTYVFTFNPTDKTMKVEKK